MKHFLSFFFLSTITCFSQDYTSEELVIPFEWHPQDLTWMISDEYYSHENFLDGRRDYTSELPYSGTGVEMLHTGFFRAGNRFVEFTQYPGVRFFFKEWSDSLKSDLLHFGEVEVDAESLEMREATLTNMDGEDSLGFELYYTFKKVGPWEFRLPDNSKLFGNYEYGKRVGTWTNYFNTPLVSPDFLPTLKTFEYEAEVLKTITQVDRSQASREEKLKLLTAKWKAPMLLDAKGVALYKQGYKVVKFSKEEKSKFPCSGRFIGVSTKNTLLKWEIKEDNTIIIEGHQFTILYLTEDRLLLKVVD